MENPIRIGRAKSRGVARSPLLAGTRVPLFTLRTSAEQMSYGSHLVLHFLITVTYGKNHKDTKTQRKAASKNRLLRPFFVSLWFLPYVTVFANNCTYDPCRTLEPPLAPIDPNLALP